MDIYRYVAFFHDGSIIDIQHVGDKIEIVMESAEMDKEDLQDDVILSKESTIQGKLQIEGIKSIKINDEIFCGFLFKLYDYAGIFDFKLYENKVEFQIKWGTYPPKPETNDFSVIEIEAEKIWWENIPELDLYNK